MVFGWYGWQLEHPEDWAPVMLTGGRKEGYARIASPEGKSIQVRWRAEKQPPALKPRLDSYLQRLAHDSRRAKAEFWSDLAEHDDYLEYRYRGPGQGRGRLFHCPRSRRVYFVEVAGRRGDGLKPLFLKTVESFDYVADNAELWALLGMAVRLPRGLDVGKRLLMAGRTTLYLERRGVKIEASRWAFGAQLIERHGMEAWARAALGLPRIPAKAEPEGLRFATTRRWPMPHLWGLVRHHPERNQLETLVVRARAEEWRPRWDWLA